MDVCLIVPCYNEELRLDILAFSRFVESGNSLLLFVDDESSDNTANVLESFRQKFPTRVKLLLLDKNSGKAEAIRQGVLYLKNRSDIDYFGFWDADLSTPLTELLPMYELISKSANDIVIGSRWKRLGSDIARNTLRHYFGRIAATFASYLLHLPVYDTQCGAKLFKRNQLTLFEEPFITRWLFDVELLARYRNKNGLNASLSRVYEYPVRSWTDVPGSKVKLLDILRLPFLFIKLHKYYNRKIK